MKTSDDFWRSSAGAWTARVDGGDPNREHLLDPVMLELCGDVRGLSVLDVGCGEGRFCRMLSTRGAMTIGIDPTPELLQTAKDRDPEGDYRIGNAESLGFANSDFDIVVSYLSLCDIPDYRAAILESARVLKPGGRYVMANVNTLFGGSAINGWLKNDLGERLHVPVDHYAFESGARIEWAGIHIVNFHRSASAYMTAFLEAGLNLRQYLEPIPSPVAIAAHPGLADGLRVPNFVVMEWSKPPI